MGFSIESNKRKRLGTICWTYRCTANYWSSAQVNQSCLWIRPERIGSDVEFVRKAVISTSKPTGSGPDSVGIFEVGFRTGLHRKRSDRIQSNSLIGLCRISPILSSANGRKRMFLTGMSSESECRNPTRISWDYTRPII